MKKILLGAVLVSSLIAIAISTTVIAFGLAQSGDVAKCSEALDERAKYLKLYSNKVEHEIKQEAYMRMVLMWHIQGKEACEGILTKEQSEWFFGPRRE